MPEPQQELTLDADAIIARACEAYGVKTFAELRKTAAFAKAFADAKGQTGVALKHFLRWKYEPADGQPPIHVPAFFIHNQPKTAKDKVSGKREVVAHEPRVLLSDGSVLTVHGAKPLQGAQAILARVAVGPVRIRHDIYGETDPQVSLMKGAEVILNEHDAPVPDVTIKGAIERLMTPRTKGKNPLGTIFGESQREVLIFATMTTGPREDVRVYPPNPAFNKDYEQLKFLARDQDGEAVSIGLSTEYAKELLVLPPETDAQQLRDAVENQPIAVNGKLSVLHPRKPEDFGKSTIVESGKKVEVLNFQLFLNELNEKGLLANNGTGKDGNPLLALNLTPLPDVETPNGPKRPLFVNSSFINNGKTNIYVLREREVYQNGQPVKDPGGQGNLREWEIGVLATEQGKAPWMWVTETHKGDKVYNEGAFIVFLNYAGGRPLDASDPFEQAARKMDLEEFGATKAAPEPVPAAKEP